MKIRKSQYCVLKTDGEERLKSHCETKGRTRMMKGLRQRSNLKRLALLAVVAVGSSMVQWPLQAGKPLWVDVTPRRREVDLNTWLPRNFVWEEIRKNPLLKGNRELSELMMSLVGFTRLAQSQEAGTVATEYLPQRDLITKLFDVIVHGGTVSVLTCKAKDDRCVVSDFKTVTLPPAKSLMAIADKRWKPSFMDKKSVDKASSELFWVVANPIALLTDNYNEGFKMAESHQDPEMLASIAVLGFADKIRSDAILEIAATTGDSSAASFKKFSIQNLQVIDSLAAPYVHKAIDSVRGARGSQSGAR